MKRGTVYANAEEAGVNQGCPTLPEEATTHGIQEPKCVEGRGYAWLLLGSAFPAILHD